MPAFSKIKRCPDDEIGKNSLNPCAIPKTNASQISIDVSPRLFASLIAMSVVLRVRHSCAFKRQISVFSLQ